MEEYGRITLLLLVDTVVSSHPMETLTQSGSALFKDDFCDLLSNLGVYNIVLNQVEDMKDVLNFLIFHRVSPLGVSLSV